MDFFRIFLVFFLRCFSNLWYGGSVLIVNMLPASHSYDLGWDADSQ